MSVRIKTSPSEVEVPTVVASLGLTIVLAIAVTPALFILKHRRK